MKATALCPGSCGELIQGVIGDRELLVSYPVNRYSRVTLLETSENMSCQGLKKVRKALALTFEFFGVPVQESCGIRIDIESDIPIGKGMASSTADIGGTVAAAARLLRKDISSDCVADIALRIEPTDSVIFKDIMLFDPLEGVVRQSLGRLPSMKVIVLEGRGVIDTLEFRKKDYMPAKIKQRQRIEEALKLLRLGMERGDCSAIGKAATISALANQEVLKKDQLERIVDRALAWGAVGVNVAHSGTVIGILVDPSRKDPEEILSKIRLEKIGSGVEKVYCLDVAPYYFAGSATSKVRSRD